MNIAVNFQGLNEYRDRIKQSPQKASYAIENAMKVFTVAMKADIKNSLNIREKEGKVYISSSPGLPPHKRTGHLFQSVYNNLEKSGKLITGTIGDNAEYAVFLEYGTSKMPPRPYIRPAVDRNMNLFERAFKQIYDQI